MVRHYISPITFPKPLPSPTLSHLSVVSYNILLPNSVDGWWNYKMYSPPLPEDKRHVSLWEYRRQLLKDRLARFDADVVCLQEVSAKSFEEDFKFMGEELGYDGQELFKKGRFRPATFWKSSRLELVSSPVHKDRTLLTSFRRLDGDQRQSTCSRNWHVLNCHLQAGKQAPRRLRQINEGVRAVLTLARKLKEKDPEISVQLVVCGDFNGGSECGAIRYLEDGAVDESFLEDGEPVTSGTKALPLAKPLVDVATAVERDPPPTLVVPEFISLMVEGEAYESPKLNEDMISRLSRIYERFATHVVGGTKQMNIDDVERWLKQINLEVGRGDEYREAAVQMGWEDTSPETPYEQRKELIRLPRNGILSLEGFIKVYERELRGGKFWGIAHDMSVLGEPLPDAGVFNARYDRIYISAAIHPTAVVDTVSAAPCPNEFEPSDHLPVAAAFQAT